MTCKGRTSSAGMPFGSGHRASRAGVDLGIDPVGLGEFAGGFRRNLPSDVKTSHGHIQHGLDLSLAS